MSKTSGYSTHPSTPAAWISLQADSLARIFPPPAKAQALPASGQDSGVNSPGLLATFDPASSSWKTAQCSLFADSMSSLATLPRSGWMQSGRLYPLPMRARPIVARESGYWRTPMACDWKNMSCSNQIYLQDQVRWPTPRARDAQPEGLQSGMDRMGKYATCSLPTAVALFPTPTVCGNYNRKGAGPNSGDGLATVVGGQLNPAWVCWLMNWPLNWFDGVKK